MDAYISDAVDAVLLLLSKGHRVLIALVGLPGSGKSTLTAALVAALPAGATAVHSLDAVRIELNGGTYPDGPTLFRLMPRTVATYAERVAADAAPVIITDNTHWRWSPDWDVERAKVAAERRWVVALTPPHSEFSLLTNRSSHGVPDAKFRTMLYGAPGLAFAPLLHRALPPAAFMSLRIASTPAAAYTAETLRDGSTVYVDPAYIGWTGATIVRAFLRGAAALPPEVRAYVGRRRGAVHITLALARGHSSTASYATMCAVARAFAAGAVPPLEFCGVGTATTDATACWYVVLSEAAHATLHAALQSAIHATPGSAALSPNADGFHVTLGCTAGDVHGVPKRTANVVAWAPAFVPAPALAPATAAASGGGGSSGSVIESGGMDAGMGMGEVAPIFVRLTAAAVDAAPLPPPRTVCESAASPDDADAAGAASGLTRCLGHPVREVAGPPELIKLLAWALQHPHLRVTPRDCSRAAPRSVLLSHGKPYLLGVNVTTGARRGPDDGVYAAFPAIQAHVPRGLTLALVLKDGVAALEPVTVHPTAKFGGDNDDDATGDVAVMDDAALAREVAGAARYIVTEKANGEMFTATVIKAYAGEPLYWVAAGSKNNKFALWCNGDGLLVLPNGYETRDATAWLRATWAPDAPDTDAARRVEWDRQQLWGEMLDEFVRTLRAPLLAYLSATSYTACAEFESHLHPHLECFAPRHRAIRYFAMTARAPGATTHAVFTAGARLEQLRTLRDDVGVHTVVWEEVPTLDLAALRQRVWRQDGKEGVVILALAADDTILRMIKLKSVWYVVNRGLRERFRGWKSEAPLRDAEAAAAKKLDEKLAIFARYPAAHGLICEVRPAYTAYTAAFARVVHAHCRESAWRARFDFDFPGVMAEARAAV